MEDIVYLPLWGEIKLIGNMTDHACDCKGSVSFWPKFCRGVCSSQVCRFKPDPLPQCVWFKRVCFDKKILGVFHVQLCFSSDHFDGAKSIFNVLESHECSVLMNQGDVSD
jgi:hypothetical protein